MIKKVLIVQGHPNKDSLSSRIAAKYKEGAEEGGALVKEIIVKDLNFNPILFLGYKRKEKLEGNLLKRERNSWRK